MYMKIQKTHSDIMNLDPKIRMVTRCDSSGNIMFSDHQPVITNL